MGMNTGELTPNPRNPRKLTEDKAMMLAKSLAEFGDLGCIVYNRRTAQLIGGHQRIKHLPEYSTIIIDQVYDPPNRTGTVATGFFEVDGESFKYREVDWNVTREMAANVAANQHGGEWDIPKLTDFINEIDAGNLDLELLGFSSEELENLMAPTHHMKDRTKDKEAKSITCPHCNESFTPQK